MPAAVAPGGFLRCEKSAPHRQRSPPPFGHLKSLLLCLPRSPHAATRMGLGDNGWALPGHF